MRGWLWAAALCAALGCDDGGGAAADAAGGRPLDGDGGCAADAGCDATPPADAAPADAAPADAAAPGCDDRRPPLVMAHGLLAAGDTWGPHAARFAANGHCPDRYVAFDWNTLNMQIDHVGDLDAVIDAARAAHGVEQVDLMGHSAGGGLGYRYLRDPARAAKVAHYVHVGSGREDGPAGPEGSPVPTLNLWSPDDTVVAGGDIEGAENVALPGLDHYAVATDVGAFEALYAFLYDAPPAVIEAPPATPIEVRGKALVLGDNAPEVDATVEVWAVGAADGQRTGEAPAFAFTVAADGGFGPFEAAPGQHYEFLVRPTRAGAPTVRYYREPFTRDAPLVYLRTLPVPPSFAGTLLRQVPFDDAHTVLVVFNARAAVLAGTDSLTVDGVEMATPELAGPEDTMIALFLYDVGVDGQDGGPVAAFGAFPFLSGLDHVIEADAAASTAITLNGRTVHVPRWPSGSEGAVIVVFE